MTVTVDFDPPDGDTWARMAQLYQRVAEMVADDVRAGERPIVLSGDCTTSLATVAGIQRAGLDPAIVWFDGHGDVQTLETTTSGYLGGMPLRMLMGYRPELIGDALGLRPVAENRVMLVDARDLDHAEIEFLHESDVLRRGIYDFTAESVGTGEDVFPAAGVPAEGGTRSADVEPAEPDSLATMAPESTFVPDGPIFLHLDLDVIDPSDLPDLLFPAPGGPGLDAVFRAVHRIMETGQVVGIGVGCTWRPGHSAADRIGSRLAEVVAM